MNVGGSSLKDVTWYPFDIPFDRNPGDERSCLSLRAFRLSINPCVFNNRYVWPLTVAINLSSLGSLVPLPFRPPIKSWIRNPKPDVRVC